jgi:hypothetical protein
MSDTPNDSDIEGKLCPFCGDNCCDWVDCFYKDGEC